MVSQNLQTSPILQTSFLVMNFLLFPTARLLENIKEFHCYDSTFNPSRVVPNFWGNNSYQKMWSYINIFNVWTSYKNNIYLCNFSTKIKVSATTQTYIIHFVCIYSTLYITLIKSKYIWRIPAFMQRRQRSYLPCVLHTTRTR